VATPAVALTLIQLIRTRLRLIVFQLFFPKGGGLTGDEKKAHFNKDTCFYGGKGGHRNNNCPKRANRNMARIHNINQHTKGKELDDNETVVESEN
jgi:hypothetical protein